MKKLKDPAEALDCFFEPLAPLRPKLSVVLWQLPPRFDVDALPRLDAFLGALPRGVRHAVEFREPSWYLEETCAVLDVHGAAFCEHDLLPFSPPRLTGGFRYLRFHGAGAKYGGRYGPQALAPVARDLIAHAPPGHGRLCVLQQRPRRPCGARRRDAPQGTGGNDAP